MINARDIRLPFSGGRWPSDNTKSIKVLGSSAIFVRKGAIISVEFF